MVGPMAAVIRSVASCVGILIEMKHMLVKRSKKCLLLREEVEASRYLHQPDQDIKPKNEHAEECRSFHVANFGGSYSSRSGKPSIYDDHSPHLEGGRAK